MDISLNPDVKMYYINLDKSVDRNENMKSLIEKFGFTNYQRVPGILTGKIEQVNLYKDKISTKAYNTLIENNKYKNRKNHSELTNGSIGCFLSHMEIYKDIVNENIPYAIIFEDDLKINVDRKRFWDLLSNTKFPKDTDIILFNCVPHDDKCIDNDKLRKIHFFFGTWFYFITNNGAKKALNHLLPINEQIDFKLSLLSYSKIMNIYHYFYKDFDVQANGLGTDIQLLGCDDCDIHREIWQIKHGNLDGYVYIPNKKRDDKIKNIFILFVMAILIILISLLLLL
jgi:GR25 family glycosyltransferase involved in LPS biosynthesis